MSLHQFVRVDTAVRPYAEDLERVAWRWTAHLVCVGEDLCTAS
jgi:hypothetical protein